LVIWVTRAETGCEVVLECVTLLDAHARCIRDDRLERREQVPVELEGAHFGAGRGEREGERPESRTDLEDAITGTDVGEACDATRGVGINEEVLSERAARMETVLGEERSHVDGTQHGHGEGT
jgi:hypothetical protein